MANNKQVILDLLNEGEVLGKVSGVLASVAAGGGSGDNITVNGVAATDADFDDATPAAPGSAVNVKWQKDAGTPNNLSAYIDAATTTAKGVAELATDGENAANVVVQGNDSRLSDARTPLSHAASHKLGGSDVILLNEFGNPTDSVEFSQQQALQFRVENRTSDPALRRSVNAGYGQICKEDEMAIYSLAQRTTVTTIAAASHGFLAPSTNEPALMEWGYFNGAATACVVGLGRSANTPTLTGGVAFLAEDEGRPTGLTQGAVAFGTAPTVPANFFRRFSMAALVGAAVVYTFPRGIVLPAGGQAIVAWNITANSAVVDIHALVDE